MMRPQRPQGRGRGQAVEKPQNARTVLQRLRKYLYFYKKRFFVAVFLTIVANVFSLIGPFLTGKAIAAMEGTVDFEKVFLFTGLMVVFYILSSVLNYILSRSMIRIAQSVVFKLRQDVFNKLNNIDISYFDRTQTGDILSRMTYDIDTLGTSLASDVIGIFTSVITVAISLVMMIIMSPILVAIFLVTLPISVILTRKLSRKVKGKYRIRNADLGNMNGYVEEMITGQKTIQAYTQEQYVYEQFKKHNKTAADSTYNAGYVGSTVGPTVNFMSNLSVALVGVFGAILYFLGSIPFSTYTSFTLYSRRFSGPINQISNIIADIQSALAASERIFRLIDYPNEKEDAADAKALDEVSGNITLNDVTFGYVKDQMVLKNVSLNVKQGDVVAIVGPTGSGKTTLVNLLMRFYDINTGTLSLDNDSVTNIRRDDLRRAFTMVLQDTWIFYGTIYENITYGHENVSMEKVIEAAKKAHIHQFIESLPDGYNTKMTDDGLNISKGQRQLLVIARAMLSDAKILILDEATSNVDTYTEIKIQEAMKQLMKGKTTFVIAHRLSTIKEADQIIVLKEGQIIEIGTHESLLSQDTFYAKLFNSQFN